MHLTSAWSIFIATLFVAISGCHRGRSTPDAAADGSWPAPVDMPFAGCAAVVRGPSGAPVCELGESARTLRVVLPSGPRTIVVPKDAPDVSVESFTIAIAPAKKLAWLDEAKAARAKGDAARAKEIVDAHVGDPDPVARALAEGMIARLELARGRAEDAFPHFEASIAAHRSAGRVSDAADDSFALAFALHQRSRRYDQARAVLDAALPDIAIYPEGRAREPYYRGILAGETGDHRGALTLLREATRRATALAMTKLARNARSSIALEMQELGRTANAIATLRELEEEMTAANDASPCERAEVANNLGWAEVLSGDKTAARAPLERALAQTACTDSYVRAFALGNLARIALDLGDVDGAERRLAEAKATVKEPRGVERIEHRLLEGRVHLARGQAPRALATIDDALAFARAAALALPEWSCLTARAETLVALGKKDDAVRALLDAEKVLDDAALLVPLGEGRASFVEDRSRSARAAIGLLVDLRRPALAARVARQSRARVLAGAARALRIGSLSPADRARWEDAVGSFRAARGAIDAAAADDWKLAADEVKKTVDQRRGREAELRSALENAMGVLSKNAVIDAGGPPARGLELLIHPTTNGWVALARDASTTTAHVLPSPQASPGELARALFDPVADRLERAGVVHVLAYGPWRAIDVHALPFRDGPLAASVTVDYPVGLAPLAVAAGDAGGRALVVGDPTGDLPSARAEANAVFRSYPAEAATLLEREAATTANVASALRASSTFHYAGHGVFAGVEGWESALPLAAGGRLGVADVLALAPVPARVVLSGCDAAKSEGDAEGLGLAQAFVVAGAKEVVAPVRPVADTLAAKVGARIHEHRDGDLAAALRDATAALRKEEPAADWAAFRVLAR